MGRQRQNGARNQTGLTDGDISGNMQGIFEDRPAFGHSLCKSWPRLSGVPSTLLGTAGGGRTHRCAKRASHPGGKRHVNK